jgi:hypothetical protein
MGTAPSFGRGACNKPIAERAEARALAQAFNAFDPGGGRVTVQTASSRDARAGSTDYPFDA